MVAAARGWLPLGLTKSTFTKGFWLTQFCACSLFLLKKTLMVFPNAK